MSSYRKNLLVGVVVLGGLIILGWMILQFADAPARISVEFTAESADGLDDGSVIYYRGVDVGKVTSVRRSADGDRIIINAKVDKDPPLPANVVGTIRSSGLIGSGAAIHLILQGETPEGTLADNARLETTYVGMNLLPPDFALLARELRLTSQQFRESGLIASLTETSNEARDLIASVNTIVKDETVRDDIVQSLHNIRTASDSASRLMASLENFGDRLQVLSGKAEVTIDEAGNVASQARKTLAQVEVSVKDTSAQVSDRLLQLSGLIQTFHSVATKVDSGDGTAGRLINDNRLYENLVETSAAMSETVKDLERLVEQWEQEGASIRLK